MATTVTLKPNAIDISGSTSGTTTLQATAVAGTTTLTLPAATDTLVGKATTDTLTNKTLGAVTLSGTVAGGGNQINNVIIGTTSPLAGSFTTLSASGAISSIGASSIYGIYRRDTNAYVGGWYAANSTISLDTAAGSAINIYSTGGVQAINTISVGNTAPSTSGAGITFPATQSASSDANTLDDYEEGTWTPVVRDAAAGTAATTDGSTGQYTKIGNVVYFRALLNNINTTGLTAANGAFITGLPFTSSSFGSFFDTPSIVTANSVTATSGSIALLVSPAATSGSLVNNTTTGQTLFLVSQLTSGNADLFISGQYFI